MKKLFWLAFVVLSLSLSIGWIGTQQALKIGWGSGLSVFSVKKNAGTGIEYSDIWSAYESAWGSNYTKGWQ